MSRKKQFIALLTFSRGEQRGILIFIILIIIVNGVRLLIPEEQPLAAEEITAFNVEAALFLSQIAEAEKNNPALSLPTRQSLAREIVLIELNGADTFDLQRLRGIGPAFARRITQYRSRLGGFTRKEQLLEVWGMDRSRYDGLKRQVTVDPEKIKRINLNQASFKELMAHPYMPFELAKEIALCRKKRGIPSIDAVFQFKGMDSVTLARLSPYLTVE